MHGSDYTLTVVKPARLVRRERLVLKTKHPRKRDLDKIQHLIKTGFRKVQELVNEADVIHFKGDEPPVHVWGKVITIPRDKKTIVTTGGSGARRHLKKSKICHSWGSIAEYGKADLYTALTADINYPGFKGIYTQQAIDSESVERTYNYDGGAYIISHSPSNIEKKSTYSIFVPAVRKLQRSGIECQEEIIHGVPFIECVERKKRSHMFFDQAGAGFYGNSALEAMQFGIPTVCHVTNMALRQSSGKLGKDCPVIMFNRDTMQGAYKAMQGALNSDMEALSIATKEFCDNFHSYRVVADMWDDIYRSL